VVRLRLDNRPGALQAFEHAVAHAATREQATVEIERIKAAKWRAPPAPSDLRLTSFRH
jgi:hypothetical protein